MANSLISLELMTSLLFQTIGIAQGIKVCKNPEIGGILFEAINDNLKYAAEKFGASPMKKVILNDYKDSFGNKWYSSELKNQEIEGFYKIL